MKCIICQDKMYISDNCSVQGGLNVKMMSSMKTEFEGLILNAVICDRCTAGLVEDGLIESVGSYVGNIDAKRCADDVAEEILKKQ